MEDLESINKMYRENYYDKSDWEEDDSIKEVPVEIHKKFEDLEVIFNLLCEGVDVKKASEKSAKERDEKKINSNNFIYGEIVL